MYKSQESKDKKLNSKRNKIKSLNEKIEELESDLKKAREEGSKNREQNLKKVKKETEQEVKKLEKELLKRKDIKNILNLALGKMFISSLYLDKENMKNQKIDLKSYLKYLDKNKGNKIIKVNL